MIKNQRGSALILTILLMLMFTILGSAFVMISTGEGIQSIRHEQDTQAHYNARSGIYMAGKWLEVEGVVEEVRKVAEENLEEAQVNNSLKEYASENKEDMEVDIKLENIRKDSGEIKIDIVSIGSYKGQDYIISVKDILIFSEENSESLPDEISEIKMATLSTGFGDNPKLEIYDTSKAYINGPMGTTVTGPGGSTEKVIKFETSGSDKSVEGMYEEIGGNKSLVIPYTSSPNGNGAMASSIIKAIEGAKQKDKKIYESHMNCEDMGTMLGIGHTHPNKIEEEIKKIYPEVSLPKLKELDTSGGAIPDIKMENTELNDLSHSDLENKDFLYRDSGDTREFKGSIYIDASEDGLDIKSRGSIKNTIFEGDVYIDAGEKSVDIRGSEFKGNLYIKALGGIQTHSGVNKYHGDVVMISGTSNTIQLGSDDFYKNFHSKSDNIYIQDGNNNFFGNNNKIVIDAQNSIQIKSTDIEGDVYMESTDNQDIQIKEGVKFDKNLFIRGGGKVQFQKVTVGGLVYAPNRYLDFQGDTTIDYAVVASSMRFKKSVKINFNSPYGKGEESDDESASSENENASNDVMGKINKAVWSKGN